MAWTLFLLFFIVDVITSVREVIKKNIGKYKIGAIKK